MLYFAAGGAFFVKVITAIATVSDILVNVHFSVVTAEFSDYVFIAQMGKTAINTALSALRIPVDGGAKLVRGKLTVRILR